MKIAIAHITGRKNPRWQWFVDSLCNQVPAEMWPEIQVIFIDRLLWADDAKLESAGADEIQWGAERYHDRTRAVELRDIVAGRFEYQHLPPKPCAHQGPFRQTKKDFFCASTSRNSAIIACRSPYLVCCDDLACPSESWFAQVRHAAEHEYLVCGMYAKRKKLVVENGKVVSFDEYPAGIDSRWVHSKDSGIVDWHGSGLFGCSFGLPLEAALEVDGFDRTGDGEGAEDYCLGIRVERAGWPVKLNRNMFTSESEEAHHEEPSLPRERKLVSADRLPSWYAADPMSDHVMLHRVVKEDRILPILGDNLREVRARYLATGLVPLPAPGQTDWRDGKLLSEL